MKYRFSLCLKLLLIAAALATTFNASGAETPGNNTVKKPWAVDLTLYAWLPSVDGKFTAGPFNKTANPDFINILEHQRNFPMTFNGHLEGHYQRVGVYLDGSYFGLDFEPKFTPGYSKGLSTRLGIMDYGVSYRLLGQSASARINQWNDQSTDFIFDAYAGGRTIWLGNEAEIGRLHASSNVSITAPVVGGRITADISPKWFVHADGNIGGFSVDNVTFTSSALGTFGYRSSVLGMPASVELGYKALSVKVNKTVLNSDITMHGPYIGLSGHW